MEVDESIFANSKDSEEKRIRMQTKLKEHIEKQKLMLERLEDTEEWKFLEDPEKALIHNTLVIVMELKKKSIIRQNIKTIL
ncbi:hypothetical protein [Providencia alcalifaciens]|uniref:hypothetical protein n=1 Tax=Providencia alcalifaciens TaxID=126385 RepID=UPI001CC51C15